MKKKIFYIVLTMIVSSLVVVVLFLTSEHIMKRENPFVRRFLPHPITDVKGLDLPYNSYYLAGYGNGHFYLGNHTAPLHGLLVNNQPKIIDTITLSMRDINKYNFSSVKWSVVDDSIVLYDHTLGAFYYGQLSNLLMTKSYISDSLFFSHVVIKNNSQYILRTYNTNRDNVNLSLFNSKLLKLDKKEDLLNEKGLSPDLFSNDGILLYNSELNRVIYVFFYKNKVYHFDSNLENRKVLKTIDTITKPNFSVKLIEKKQQLQRSQNAIVVHKMAATAGDFIFIASDRIGKNEQKKMYKTATIIDVYSISKNTYEHSFYFYHYKDTPISEFKIFKNYIIGIGKNTLSIAKFKQDIYKQDIAAQRSGISRKPVKE